MNLIDQRRISADEVFAEYDFGKFVVVGDSGWEYESPGWNVSKPVFLELSNDHVGDSIKCTFEVTFDGMDSADVIKCRAFIDGQEIGHLPPPRKAAP